MIVLCGGGKGGTGKSTFAMNIAASYAVGGADVMLLDTDPQGTAAKWVARRTALHPEAPRIHCARQAGDVYATVADLAGRYEHVVIDAGGYDSEEVRSAMGAAHRMVVTVRPGQADIETMGRMDRLYSEVKRINPALRGVVVINQAPTHHADQQVPDAEEALEGLQHLVLLDVVVHLRKIYADALKNGLGVVEENDPKARQEIEELHQGIQGGKHDVS